MEQTAKLRGERTSCCKDCPRRTTGCHSRCEEYAAEVILTAALRGEYRRERDARNDVDDFYVRHYDRVRKIKNRRGNKF